MSRPSFSSHIQLEWMFFCRYLLSRRAGSVIKIMARISWIATFIGVFSLILVASIMNGFNRNQSHRLLNLEPHVLVKGAPVSVASELKKTGLVTAEPYWQSDVIIRSAEGHFSGAVAKGMSESAIDDFLTRNYRATYQISDDDTMVNQIIGLGSSELVMDSDLAQSLRVFEGDEVILIPPEALLSPAGENTSYAKLRIKKVFSSQISGIGARTVYFVNANQVRPFQTAKNTESGVEVRFLNPDLRADHKQFVVQTLGSDRGYFLESWADRNRALFKALKLEKFAMLSLLGISVLITSFSLITVIIMLISQKKKDIRLLISVGFSRARTERLFVRLGLILCLIGLLPGILLGVGASVLLQKFPIQVMPDIYYDSSLPAEVNYLFVVAVAVLALFISWITARIPISRAAKNMVMSHKAIYTET